MSFRALTVILIVVISFTGCSDQHQGNKLFAVHKGRKSGIDFRNTIVTNDTLNALSFEYIYNGSGVGVGDFNNDGFQDLFFGGNQVSSRLYLNDGNLRFRDVTEKAGITTSRWITGVSVVDINLDGLQDIYLSVAGKTDAGHRKNLLFINEGITEGVPSFRESASSFGLDDDSYSTMAAFFDYDKDGDPDMYLLNNWLEPFNRNNLRPIRMSGEAESTDKLYKNNGDGTFTNISAEAGILIEGYGLGVAICDINDDSWPDVYVANDFMSNDLLWINQKNGTFRNSISDYLKHQTHNGMGVDIADFNNDALQDIVVVDMLPPGHVRQKLMTPGQNYDHFHLSLELGYQPQYMRNTLQLNRGKTEDGRMLFSEIAFAAGMAQTDWSWAPLFADFDNDGWKDLFIANGYRKDVTNLDFIFFAMEGSPFGTQKARVKKFSEKLNEVADVKLSNYVFRNTGAMQFEDMTEAWGTEIPTFSNGAAYADLDNDGDLDIITNNIDQEVIIYENQLNNAGSSNHYIRLMSAEPVAFNEKIKIYAGHKMQLFEHTPYRGFQSTVENIVHAGVGNAYHIDSIVIEWPDNLSTLYKNIPSDTLLVYSRTGAAPRRVSSVPKETYFALEPSPYYVHKEKSPSDIKVTRTLLHDLARSGPCLAKGDINGDGLDDFFVGDETGISPKIFIQQKDGSFTPSGFFMQDAPEIGDALFIDSDNDGDLDLYIASTASSAFEKSPSHRFYRNDGIGNFSIDHNAIPQISISASCVEGADYDGDGDIDIFVGGRISPGTYPLSTRSYILNNNNGKFSDVTKKMNPSLAEPGMVSSAVWIDVNNDRKPDLILTGEWQPVRVFLNEGPGFREVTDELGLTNTHGWWNCLEAADLNNDGFIDIVAGNTGRNSFFRPDQKNPIELWVKDFDSNGSVDPIVTYYNPVEKERFMVHNRLVLIDQIPGVKKKFETFSQYAVTPFHEAFTRDELKGAVTLHASKLESAILINNNGISFTVRDLPDVAQISVINDILTDDVNNDGATDIVAIGNSYSQETLFGWYDASIGTILLGDNEFNFKEMPATESGLIAEGDVRYIERFETSDGKVYVITCNNDKILLYRLTGKGH